MNVGRELRPQLSRGGEPERHRRRRIGDDEASKSFRLTDGMLGAQHAAPRLAEQMIVVRDAELLEEILELVEKEVDGPEVGALVSQMRRPSVAELVVVNDRPSGARDVGDGQQIVVRAARAAVRRHERRASGREIARDAIPGFPPAKIDSAFCRRLEKRRRRGVGHGALDESHLFDRPALLCLRQPVRHPLRHRLVHQVVIEELLHANLKSFWLSRFVEVVRLAGIREQNDLLSRRAARR